MTTWTRIMPEPETLARWFHDAYERLAPEFGYRTRAGSSVPWEQVPVRNRGLMVAVATEVLHKMQPTDPRVVMSHIQRVLRQASSPAGLIADKNAIAEAIELAEGYLEETGSEPGMTLDRFFELHPELRR